MENKMKINDQTKISELIRADKASIDAIAGVAKPFHRLKNPILRKVMASRVTIAEAAKMGGCRVTDIILALTPLGFEYEATENGQAENGRRPEWFPAASENNVIHYDVRPIIESGTDPLKAILGKFKEIPAGHILCIVNSFVPTPLIRLLEQDKAEASYVETISDHEYHTYFLKKQKETAEKDSGENRKGVIMDDARSFEAVHRRFSPDQIRETDVRHLEMPLPMQTILAALGELPAGHALYVHHKRVPVYLLEELAGRDFEVHIHTVDENNVKMMLFKPE